MWSKVPGSRKALSAALVAAGVFILAAALAGAAGAAPLPRPVVSVSPAAFSPNHDSLQDTAAVTVKLRSPGRLSVGVYDGRGRLVKVLLKARAVRAGTRSFSWDGLRNGRPLPSGAYAVKATLTSGKRSAKARAGVVIDLVPPACELSVGVPNRVFAGTPFAFAYRVLGEEVVAAALEVYADAQTPVAVVPVPRPQAQGTVEWRGTAGGGGYLATGEYQVRLTVTDAAGNAGATRCEPVNVYAPVTVTGTVRTATGAPVEGATVAVGGTELTAVTGAGGAFSIAGCPMGFRTFTVTAPGQASGSRRVSVNLSTVPIELVTGANASVAEARTDDSVVTVSGRMLYLGKDGEERPMRNVRVILQDDATTYWDDLMEGSTDDQGNFSFTYDYRDIWDIWGYPDVRVIAQARDGADGIVSVFDGITALYPYTLAGNCWDDNTQDRTGVDYIKTGEHDRLAWFMLECVMDAHLRWEQLTGFSTAPVWIDYPEDVGAASAQFEIARAYKCINVTDRSLADLWRPSVYYHEYGHVTHHSAYWAFWELNAYSAYSGSFAGSSFYANGRYYSEKDNTESQGETQGGAWSALKEGFAEFYAAVIKDWDSGALAGTLERNAVHAGLDDDRVAHSLARALWDAYDGPSTPFCCWGQSGADWATWTRIARPVGPVGPGDDDRMTSTRPFSSGDVVRWVWEVLDEDWPADVHELRTRLRARHPANLLQLRAFDVALYANGVCRDEITETPPSLTDVQLVGERNTDGSYRGVVKVYCSVTDPDVVGGDKDADHLKVRLEGNVSQTGFTADPLGFTLEKAPSPPPQESGDSWYVVEWDTRLPSPCEARYSDLLAGYGYEWNEYADTNLVIPGRRSGVQLRVAATDDLVWTTPTTLPSFDVDNGAVLSPLFARYAVAPTYVSGTAIHWPAGGWAGTQYGTCELWYRPAANAWGTIAAITYADPKAPSPGRYPVMELGIDMFGNAFFTVNSPGSGGPGSGTAHTVRSTTVLKAGTWYHLAAQYGAGGQRLYVNGAIDGADADYHGWPRPDSGSPSDPAFSVGQYGDWLANTALGSYEELQVSAVSRHGSGGFTPPTAPYDDPDSLVVILDHFDGTTSGVDNGFTFAP